MTIVFHGGRTEHRSVRRKRVSPSQCQFDRNSISKTLEKSPCYQSCTTLATARICQRRHRWNLWMEKMLVLVGELERGGALGSEAGRRAKNPRAVCHHRIDVTAQATLRQTDNERLGARTVSTAARECFWFPSHGTRNSYYKACNFTRSLSLSLSHAHTHTHTHSLSPSLSLSLTHTHTLSLSHTHTLSLSYVYYY